MAVGLIRLLCKNEIWISLIVIKSMVQINSFELSKGIFTHGIFIAEISAIEN